MFSFKATGAASADTCDGSLLDINEPEVNIESDCLLIDFDPTATSAVLCDESLVNVDEDGVDCDERERASVPQWAGTRKELVFLTVVFGRGGKPFLATLGFTGGRKLFTARLGFDTEGKQTLGFVGQGKPTVGLVRVGKSFEGK